MNDGSAPVADPAAGSTLPMPTRERWQPLRLGVIELFHYDSEEFHFRDGHLLLRGNNGTGKSKVLSLTLPFLLDARLMSSRIEPDGDSGKKMAWNLLMNSYDRRIGYTWIEFGRLDKDGNPHFLSLGCGMSAAAARPQVDAWFFIVDDNAGTRINRDLWLMNANRVALTKEHLRTALQGRGQLFEAARDYRRAVDERLFQLGPRRYDALMDTLIQLRQPQLSKRPDETALSEALTEALPPLGPDLLGDVADALGQLEEDRRQLEQFQALATAVGRFETRYRTYAGTQSRRQARHLRHAQTEFDTAGRARHEAQTAYEHALAEEAHAKIAHDEAEAALRHANAQLDALRLDPAMQDARSLDQADEDARRYRNAAKRMADAAEETSRRLNHARRDAKDAAEHAAHAAAALAASRRETAELAADAGLAGPHGDNPLIMLDVEALSALDRRDVDAAVGALQTAVRHRRDGIGLVRQRLDQVGKAEHARAEHHRAREEQRDEAEQAAEHRAEADANVESQGKALVENWERHLASLTQLAVAPRDGIDALAALAAWVGTMEGDNPAQRLLGTVQQHAAHRFAERKAAIDGRRGVLDAEATALEEERRTLESGTDPGPPIPYTREPAVRDSRPGHPLWQLVDFKDTVGEVQRAGLEAALEAAGLLDAWVSPEGMLQTGGGSGPLHDTQLVLRPPCPSSLADWLVPALPPEGTVAAEIVDRLLSAIACADEDEAGAEAWVAPDGRFRLGVLAGAWSKPAASHVGFAARAAARARRLAEIAGRTAGIATERADLEVAADRLARDRNDAEDEWHHAPTDGALRTAHSQAVAAAQAFKTAQVRLEAATKRLDEAVQALQAARRRLATDAADLRLPETAEALSKVERALDRYRDMLGTVEPACREVYRAMPGLQRARLRESETENDLQANRERMEAARGDAADADARLELLRSTVGAKVDELRQRLAELRQQVATGDEMLKQAGQAWRDAGEARAVAGQQATSANQAQQRYADARADAVVKWQQFVGVGLLAAAIPTIELPDASQPWTIDPALTLARRAEQALAELKDDDANWANIQRQVNGELTELHSALVAQGHHALTDVGDWGLVVHVVYQNRPERPGRLAARLADEIIQRSELLTAREREVLENHLQAEIAAEIQRLLRNAERHCGLINEELARRPTSTGVRFRLVWQTRSEDEGAPPGLDAARKRLLNMNADLWSAEDRGAVGAMLQHAILAERERADAEGGGNLQDQLAAALDYRRWHRFRVERWQDGQWRKLSGPASSGERALGLTVPLFAAVASFYGRDTATTAPRLMLLDEAFAGIDDAARAHCMGLIHEFDLDFVLTSEREWACYADLPGVAICQLQRREGIDAVFVSRWTWDGRARRRDADPDCRFPPA